ncbi:Protein RGF1 INDUCIBLE TRANSCRIPTION FACTOR 1 [Cardamine amara subsp. amara]|uniref:Protein RGF1 INDUCIBLE TRANSCRIPTION FACTOR 1 n=1 Tax=Cardamine amara subsp. amara TaxID=228776 RepID=A0ABD1BQ15_CARAN
MESGEFPAWLEVLLKEKFFNACLEHEDVKKNEKNILCIDCCLSICPHCISFHTSHRLLQIRRYVYRDVLRVEDGSKLMDCSLIQPYITNSSKVVFINERPVSRQFRGSGNFCVTCDRCLQSPYLFCSLSCKISDVIMRQRGLSGFLRVCNFLPLIDEGTTTTPSSTLEPTGSSRTSSESGGNEGGGEDMFWCQALACTATTEIVRKKRSSLSTSCRRVTVAISPTNTEAPASFLNRRKNTLPQRAPLY